MYNKVLTVVIPTYNMENFLRRCLDSLIVPEEEMSKLEVLVINDGSKDGSSAIAHEYESKYPDTFKVIDKENGNYGSCINKGLLEASGKYIKILDADDWYDNEKFIHYLNKLQNIDSDLIFNDYAYVRLDGEIAKEEHIEAPQYTIYEFFGNDDKRTAMHSIAYRTENLRKLGYYQTEGISHTDMQWASVPLLNVRTAYYIPDVLYMYQVGREGQTMDPSNRRKRFRDSFIMVEGILDALENAKIDKDLEHILKDKFLGIVNNFYKEIIFTDDRENADLLREFDERFEKKFPELYKESESYMKLSHKVPCSYLPYWRKNGKVDYKNILILFYKMRFAIKHRQREEIFTISNKPVGGGTTPK